jgi:citrate lyase subunit beta/citryl-CoA lyase
MTVLHAASTFLFAPGNSASKLRRALESRADAVICDLEDAVPAANKQEARDVVSSVIAGWLATPTAQPRPLLSVRVNSDGDELARDLDLLARLPLDAVVVPKASLDLIESLPTRIAPLVSLIETAVGLRCAFEIASHPSVAALMLGTVDLALELGLSQRSDGRELLFARSSLVVDSAAAGLRAPIDGPRLDFHNDTDLRGEVRAVRSLGFGGKACIHPRQLPVVAQGFAAGEHDLDWARRVVERYDAAVGSGTGTVAVDGEMVDRPVAEQARRVLARAKAGLR